MDIKEKKNLIEGSANAGDMNMKLIYQHMQLSFGYLIDLRQCFILVLIY